MRVVNVLRDPNASTHYIGRYGSWRSAFGQFCDLGNPYVLGPAYERDDSIVAFESWARTHPEVLKRIAELPQHAVLGCWCKPLACHGDVIIKLWLELRELRIARECKAADDAHERDLDRLADDGAESR